MGNADVADMPPGTGAAHRLHHRLLGTHGLHDGMRAQAVGEVLYAVDAFLAALFDDVRGAELAGELLPG